MNIALDLIGTNAPSGSRTYLINFCNQLLKHYKKKIVIFVNKDYLKDINIKKKENVHIVEKPNYYSYGFIRLIWVQLILPIELIKFKVSRVFSPLNICPLILRFSKIRSILCVHTNLPWVEFEKMPGNFFKKILIKKIMELSIKFCDSLIVNSYYAKNELLKKIPINKKKINVVYLGIDNQYLKKKNLYFLKQFNYKQKYFLSILSCARYHNIIKILSAFKLLKKKKSLKLKVVFVMSILDKSYFLEIKRFINQNFDKKDIIILQNVNQLYLVNLYKNSKFYIFSSYSEVFGLTSLEAMTQSCPVLLSKKSALPEINKNAAIYFNPDNEINIMNCMKQILNNKKLKNRLIKKGNFLISKYNWKNNVSKTINIILKKTRN